MTNDSWKAGLLVLALLAALGVLCPLVVAPYIPLVDPDEGLHASIAQEMVESGDWTVPHLLNEPFLDKPILYFWAIATSLKIFGMSAAAVRLPGLLLGMLGTLTTAAVAWRLLGRRIGLIAGVFYASMILPLGLVQVPGHDVALVPLVNLALLCFWESDRVESRSRAWTLTATAGMVLGLAILTKGLAGIALVGIAYGGYLIFSRRLRSIHCRRAALALTLAAIIGLSWYFAVERARPGFLRYYFFERHVLGFLTKSQPHGGAPWWYYFPILVAGGIPWVGYLPVLLHDAVNRWRKGKPAVTDARGNRPLLLLCCWFVGCTLFLTVSRSKLVTYIWPVFPAMAILSATVWARKIEGMLSDGADALDEPDRLVHLPDWSAGTAGHLRHYPDRIADTVPAADMDAGDHRGVDIFGTAGKLGPRPGSLDARAGGNDRLRSNGRSFALRRSPRCRGALGRDLADYINRTGELPSRIVMAQERIGSVVFYLDRDLRSQLQFGQMTNQDIDDPLPLPALGTEEWIVIPERHLHTALHDYDLSSLPYEQAGRFRLYRRSDAEPRELVSQADCPLLR